MKVPVSSRLASRYCDSVRRCGALVMALLVIALSTIGALSCSGRQEDELKDETEEKQVRGAPDENARPPDDKTHQKMGLIPGSLPALKVGAQYKAPPPPEGGTYGLRYHKVLEGSTTIEPKYMWVHSVKRLVPGTTLDDAKKFAAKLDLKYNGVEQGSRAHRFRGPPAKASFYAKDSNFRYYSGADKPLRELNTPALKALAKNFDFKRDKAEDAGKEWMRKRGILPPNIHPRNDGTSGIITYGVQFYFSFRYPGQVENRRCWGPGEALEYEVLFNSKIYTINYCWTESERLGTVECKTRVEAIEAFNRGEAGHLRKELWGGWCGLMERMYYAEGPGSTHLQPCFYLRVAKAGDIDFYYVPMAKANYFQNPKKQVEVLKDIR